MLEGELMENKIRIFRRSRSDLPIDVSINHEADPEKEFLNDISLGGLSFKSKVPIQENKIIEITMPLTYPVFQVIGRVRWCRKEGDYYVVGIKFVIPVNELTIEAVEEVCDIDEYRNEVYRKEGRVLSSEDAAVEWLNAYIKEFKE
jgi:hypothetical protein